MGSPCKLPCKYLPRKFPGVPRRFHSIGSFNATSPLRPIIDYCRSSNLARVEIKFVQWTYGDSIIQGWDACFETLTPYRVYKLSGERSLCYLFGVADFSLRCLRDKLWRWYHRSLSITYGVPKYKYWYTLLGFQSCQYLPSSSRKVLHQKAF